MDVSVQVQVHVYVYVYVYVYVNVYVVDDYLFAVPQSEAAPLRNRERPANSRTFVEAALHAN